MARQPKITTPSHKVQLKWLLHSPATMLVVALIAVGIWYGQYHTATSRKVIVQKAAAHHQTVKPAPAPAKTTAPAPAPAPAPQPAPAPVKSTPAPTPKPVKAVVPASAPQPVVTPSPSSNVSGLAPIAPTTSPSTGSSTGTTTGSSGSGSGSTSTAPQPATAIGYTSTNWSGYMATHGSFTAISGSWTAPQALGNGTTTSADSSWIGIGGVTSGDLIQVGTQDIVSASGKVSTAAFYEILPDVAQTISTMTVKPGDSMTADIHQLASGQWSVTITDNTNGGTFTISLSYASSLSSAEWIEEDPSYSSGQQIPFDNYQTVTFTNASTTYNGAIATISGSGAQAVAMVDNTGKVTSMPSVLASGGTGFTATRQGL